MSDIGSMVVKLLAFVLFSGHVGASSSYDDANSKNESPSVSISTRDRVISNITLDWLNRTTLQITRQYKEIDLIHLKAGSNFDGKTK